MSVRIHNITFDCADARALAGFWSTLTGWNVYYDDDPEVVLAPSFPYDGTGMLFIPVPEGRQPQQGPPQLPRRNRPLMPMRNRPLMPRSGRTGTPGRS